MAADSVVASAPDALLWILLGSVRIPVEITHFPGVVQFEAPDWVPDAVLDDAHRIIFGGSAHGLPLEKDTNA
jgi:hypothetical protein